MPHNHFHLPYPGEYHRVFPCWTWNHRLQAYHDVLEAQYIHFLGPLLRPGLKKKHLMAFIHMKSQESLWHMEVPEQKEAYFFWLILELLCYYNGNVLLVQMANVLFKGYNCLRRKVPNLVSTKTQRNWCLPLARLLCSSKHYNELRQAILDMADNLASRGQMFAAHICCVAAQCELGSYNDGSFDLIGCGSFPIEKSDFREAMKRSEVYEYVLFLISGFAQPNFQKYKLIYATMLANEGFSAVALDYCESIARAVTTFPYSITAGLMKDIILMSEKLLHGTEQEPEWLLKLRKLNESKVYELNKFACMPQQNEIPEFQPFYINDAEVASRYIIGKLLGKGGFAPVFAAVRKADGKKVALKYVSKSTCKRFFPIPGNRYSLPMEVALMQMVLRSPRCENVVELLEWFEMSTYFIFVLERFSPCMNLYEFCMREGPLIETRARYIMWQVVRAVLHCCDRRVFHRDIKPQNILVNTRTLGVKLIDFGCGDFLKDIPYTVIEGTPEFWPPEWIKFRQYMGRPATVWTLGVLLYYLIYSYFPFNSYSETVTAQVPLHNHLSKDCQDLILWCLEKNPKHRAKLHNIIEHRWFFRCNSLKTKRRTRAAKLT